MNERLYEYLREYGFFDFSPEDVSAVIAKMSKRQIVDIALGAINATAFASREAASPYEFSASGTFAGAPQPCAMPSCRLSRVSEAAYFTALYADRLLVTSPFYRVDRRDDADEVRTEFLFSILMTLYLKPLIETGLVEFVEERIGRVCVSCCCKLLANEARGGLARVEEVVSEVRKAYRDRVRYYAEYSPGSVCVVPEGGDDLFDEHPGVFFLDRVPTSVRKLRKRARRKRLPLSIVDELEIPNRYASLVVTDMLSRDICAARFKTGYLSARAIDLQIVEKLELSDLPDESRATPSLVHSLPTMYGARLSSLVELRKQEGQAFENYRVALRRASAEIRGLQAIDVSELMSDVVDPEIRRMTLTLQAARRNLLTGLSADFTGAAATVAASLSSGLVSSSIAAVVGTVGGIHFTTRVLEKLSKIVATEPESARPNAFYFMWRASRIGLKAKAALRRG